MFTERRGSDAGNMIAISAGLLATVVVGKLDIAILRRWHSCSASAGRSSTGGTRRHAPKIAPATSMVLLTVSTVV
jgi:hypothetical protein